MNRLPVISLMLLMSSAATAGSEDAAATGLGTRTCAEFAELSKLNPDAAGIGLTAWMQGFMSGLNAAFLMMKRGAADLGVQNFDVDYQKQLLASFCRENPSRSVVDGVLEVFLDISKRQGFNPTR